MFVGTGLLINGYQKEPLGITRMVMSGYSKQKKKLIRHSKELNKKQRTFIIKPSATIAHYIFRIINIIFKDAASKFRTN